MTTPVRVTLVEGPLPPHSPGSESGAGAVWMFEGVVRPLENERQLVALDYEAYEPMTSRELRRLADSIAAEFELLSLTVEHSVGRIRPGERSFRLIITSAHRMAGHEASAKFIDEMKRSIPLWKNAVYHTL